jgi:hypothetical protein
MTPGRVPGATFGGHENNADFCIDFGGHKGSKRAHFGVPFGSKMRSKIGRKKGRKKGGKREPKGRHSGARMFTVCSGVFAVFGVKGRNASPRTPKSMIQPIPLIQLLNSGIH